MLWKRRTLSSRSLPELMLNLGNAEGIGTKVLTPGTRKIFVARSIVSSANRIVDITHDARDVPTLWNAIAPINSTHTLAKMTANSALALGIGAVAVGTRRAAPCYARAGATNRIVAAADCLASRWIEDALRKVRRALAIRV